MMPDVRFLIFLNCALAVIGFMAALRVITIPRPNPDLSQMVERVKTSSTLEQAVEHAASVEKIAARRAERIARERRFAAIITGFGAFAGITNLIFFVSLYRKMKAGVYLQQGVELTKE